MLNEDDAIDITFPLIYDNRNVTYGPAQKNISSVQMEENVSLKYKFVMELWEIAWIIQMNTIVKSGSVWRTGE